jgi:hypothetical protein
MTTLALIESCPSTSNVIDFVKRLQADHGPPRIDVEQQIRSDVAAQLGAHPNLDYAKAQAVRSWKTLQRSPLEAVRVAVACARNATSLPPVCA